MNINDLVNGLMIAYLICAYFIAYRFALLAHRASKSTAVSFGFKWYERLAVTYVLALPIFLLLVI
ncbi:MAG TPA: hypothetical protein DEV38_07505 [Psychrobacter sp.]|nr:hypothetical protein [Psychrobacter sp.]